MTLGLVSTIIPVFNRPAQLSEAVASVLAQDYRPIEVIIVDDGSTDGATDRVIRDLLDSHKAMVRATSQPNGGPGRARECGRQLARGEFIQYLDSDDILLPGKFSSQVAALRAKPEADVAYGATLHRDAFGKLNSEPHKDTGVARETMFPTFLNSRWWDTATPLYRRAATDAIGPWTDLQLEEDWEYDCRVAALSGHLAYCPMPVSETRDHVGDRLSRGSNLDHARMRVRARSHGLIWAHALSARLPDLYPAEVAVFSRSLFLLCRQCASIGLAREAEDLLMLAKAAAKASGRLPADLIVFDAMSRIVGFSFLGRVCTLIDNLRARRG